MPNHFPLLKQKLLEFYTQHFVPYWHSLPGEGYAFRLASISTIYLGPTSSILECFHLTHLHFLLLLELLREPEDFNACHGLQLLFSQGPQLALKSFRIP